MQEQAWLPSVSRPKERASFCIVHASWPSSSENKTLQNLWRQQARLERLPKNRRSSVDCLLSYHNGSRFSVGGFLDFQLQSHTAFTVITVCVLFIKQVWATVVKRRWSILHNKETFFALHIHCTGKCWVYPQTLKHDNSCNLVASKSIVYTVLLVPLHIQWKQAATLPCWHIRTQTCPPGQLYVNERAWSAHYTILPGSARNNGSLSSNASGMNLAD